MKKQPYRQRTATSKRYRKIFRDLLGMGMVKVHPILADRGMQFKEYRTYRVETMKLLKNSLPKTKNIDLILLKGHVIIEYVISKFIEIRSGGFANIEKTRLRFSQKADVAFMLGLTNDYGISDCLAKLNTLRNQIAHKLEYDSKLLGEFIKSNELDLPMDRTAPQYRKLLQIIEYRCYEVLDWLNELFYMEYIFERERKNA